MPAVYSLENVKYPQADGSVCGIRPQLGADAALKLDCGAGLGAATHITGTFAFVAVGKALEMLLKPRARQRYLPQRMRRRRSVWPLVCQ